MVVVGIEAQHLVIMADSFVTMTEAPKGQCQLMARAHVRSGLDQTPERTDVVLEGGLAQRFCADGDGSPVKFERIVRIGGFPRKDEIGVSAEWGQRQRFSRQRNPLASPRRFHGLEGLLLSEIERFIAGVIIQHPHDRHQQRVQVGPRIRQSAGGCSLGPAAGAHSLRLCPSRHPAPRRT